MKYYQEITLIPQADIASYVVWSWLYTQLHLALVEQKDSQAKVAYGVAFPQYQVICDKNIAHLGYKLRVFASSVDELTALNLNKWLERLTDYVHIASIKPVPSDKITGYVQFYRVIPKMSLEQRIQHQAKRHNVSLEQAKRHLQDYQDDSAPTPFVRLPSQSTGQQFSLHIGKRLTDGVGDGRFGTYGLSRSASVPAFA